MLHVGWRNLFSFPVVLLCQFFLLAGNRLWFYILLVYLEYHLVVVLCLVFLVLVGNSFRCFVHMVLIVQYSCVVVSVFGSGGKYTLLLYIPLLALTDGETNTLASRGLKEPYFQLCCCVVSVFGSRGKCGNLLYIIFHRIVLGSSGK